MNDPVPQMLAGMPPKFDYACLAPEDVLYVKRKTNEVRHLNNNKGSRICGRDVFAIGAILLDIKGRMSRNAFSAWLTTEAQIPHGVSKRYMAVAKRFGHEASKLGNIGCSVLYELSLPSYPQFFLEKVLSGTYIPSLEEVKRMRISQSKTEATLDMPQDGKITLQDLSSQISLMQQKIQEIERSTAPSEIEQKIIDLQGKLQSLTDTNDMLTKELDIANNAIAEKNEEIEKLQEDIESLSRDRDRLLEKCGKDGGKLNRIIMTIHQICNEN